MGIERGMAWCLVLARDGRDWEVEAIQSGTYGNVLDRMDWRRRRPGLVRTFTINHQPGRYSRMGDRVMELALPLFAISS
jgi:hypothetical protein